MRTNRLLSLACTVLATAAAHAPARSQSLVRINGLLDIGVYRAFDGTRQVGTIQRSNLAVSGAEDLGGGLKAIFRLSTRLELDTGSNEGQGAKPFWHDESTVGLQGGWGTLRLGRALTPLWAHDWKFDPWGNFNRIASPAWYQWHYLTPSDPHGNGGSAEYGRLSNGVFYDSPTLAGVTLHLSASPEIQRALGATRRSHSTALEYAQGPLAGLLAFERNSVGDRVAFVAGKYSFGAAALMAAHDDSRTSDGSGRSRATTFGATYQLSQVRLKAGYGRQRLNDDTNRFASLGADYALSRRTIVYASLGHQRNEQQPSRTAYGVGVSHAF